LIALIPKLTENLDLESESDRQLILDSLDFIRSYADRFHHAKEEDILFSYTDEDSDIVKVIYEDHKNARNHVKAVAEALEERDKAKIIEHLNAYKELLTEHIKKEDEILYPWIDT
jgi:hemerythrin-like domain-containing protein